MKCPFCHQMQAIVVAANTGTIYTTYLCGTIYADHNHESMTVTRSEQCYEFTGDAPPHTPDWVQRIVSEVRRMCGGGGNEQ